MHGHGGAYVARAGSGQDGAHSGNAPACTDDGVQVGAWRVSNLARCVR